MELPAGVRPATLQLALTDGLGVEAESKAAALYSKARMVGGCKEAIHPHAMALAIKSPARQSSLPAGCMAARRRCLSPAGWRAEEFAQTCRGDQAGAAAAAAACWSIHASTPATSPAAHSSRSRL